MPMSNSNAQDAFKRQLEQVKAQAAKFRKVVRSAELTTAPLVSDSVEAMKQCKQNPESQFWPRTVIRCLCATIEAQLFTFRKMAEQMGCLSGQNPFTKDEEEILAEQRITIVNGVRISKPKWLRFPDSVTETFRLFGKANGARLTIDYGGTGFVDLRTTFEIRNRLMHPKQPFDVRVTEQEVETADRAMTWFTNTTMDILKTSDKHERDMMAQNRKRVPPA
jgi:hypothetical protein